MCVSLKKSKEMGCVGRVQHSQKFARFFVRICKLGIFVCCLKECQGQLSSIPFATIGQFVRKRSVKNTYGKTPEESEKFEIVWHRNLATVLQCYVFWNPQKGEINDETINRFWGKKPSIAEPYYLWRLLKILRNFHPRISTLLWPLVWYSYGGYCCVVYVQYSPLKHCRRNNYSLVARGHWRRWIFFKTPSPNWCGKEFNFTQASSQLLC